MLPLLATSAASLDGAREVAGGLKDLGLYYVCGIQSAVIAVLFGLLLRSWALRLRDAMGTIKEVSKAVDANTQQTAAVTSAVTSKIPTPRKPRSAHEDTAGGEPGTGPASPQPAQTGGPPAGV